MLKARAFAILFAAALLPTAALPAKPVTKGAVKRDWTQTVIVTPEGGFRMGNPAAKVKLVEYGSLACPHCRHFEETGFKPLVQRYVRTGQVSYEFRNFLLNAPDISVSLLTRCAGASNFFAMSGAVIATQPQWQQKLGDLSDAEKAKLEKLTNQERVVRVA
jgi:protein-disulfide isomerase